MTAALRDIEALLAQQGLSVSGGVSDGDLPEGCQSLLLCSPTDGDFWPLFTASPEYLDGQPDPIDRWSQRVLSQIASDIGGTALFPFGGPPYQPFLAWARASGRAHVSPVGMLVHDAHGLWISYRGALALPYSVSLPEPPPKPCTTCHAPCLTSCPVNAIGPDGYNTATCHAWLDTKEQDCMAQGCAIRRACPAGAAHGRLPEQSAFHMRSFHP